METLEAYRERYRSIADRGTETRLRRWGAHWRWWRTGSDPARSTSGGSPSQPLRPSTGRWARLISSGAITLLQAGLGVFRSTAPRAVSPEMRKGPRGGGRDRDRIIRHTIRVESEDFAKQVGLVIPEEAALTPDGLRQASGDLRRGDARVQRLRDRENGCGRGRSRSSFDTRPSTRSTTPGRWRTRISPPRTRFDDAQRKSEDETPT